MADTDALIGLSGKDTLDTETSRILEVTGQGEVTVPTTSTQVQLGILVQAETAAEVQEQVAQRSTAVVDVLENLGAQELQTTSIQLNPVYNYENGTQTLTGFEGRNTLQFELPTDEAGAAIDSAIQAGANVVENITFTASDEALEQARLQVLSQAVEDAQTQSEAVLSTLQLAPGEIIDIDINTADAPPPSPLLFDAAKSLASAESATTPILGGPQTVEGSVALDILYSPDSVGTLTPGTDGITDALTGSSKQAPAIIDPLTGGTDTNTSRSLEVTGQGEVTVPTTSTQVQLGILVQAETAAEVQEQVAQRSTAVIDVLENLGAQELQTTSIQLNPVYNYENATQTLTGFEGRNTLQFELPTDEAGAAIDSAIQAGANVVQNISFIASDEALDQARLQALSQAVEDAQTQAEAVFSTLDLAPGEIIKININAADVPPPSPLLFDVAANAGSEFTATTPILGGAQTVEASVSLDILYSPNSADILALA
jgi:hypothetical protein